MLSTIARTSLADRRLPTFVGRKGADHTVFIDEDGRRRRHVLTVFPRSRMQHRNRVYQLVVMIGHDTELRKILLRLLGLIQTIDRNGDDAGVALGESVVMRLRADLARSCKSLTNVRGRRP